MRSEPDLLEREARRDRDRGPALLQAQGRRLQGHRARDLGGRAPPARRPGRARRSPSSSSRTRWSPRRTGLVFQKLREAALAYQLERKWTKDKILTEYLNTVYFGEGAYGIESAARVYFGWNHPGCEPDCAAVLEPAEAALLAGHDRLALRLQPGPEPGRGARAAQPRAAADADQDLLTTSEYRDAVRAVAAAAHPRSRAPRKVSKAPYFTSWVEDQLVRPLRDREHLRRRPEDPHDARPRPPEGRRAGDRRAPRRRRAERRAGRDRQRHRRHPRDGRRLGLPAAAVQPRHPGTAPAGLGVQAVHPRRGARERHLARPHVRLRARRRSRARAATSRSRTTRTATPASISLAGATTVSDNSVYAEVGYKLVGTRAVAKVAHARWACARPISRNPAMVLGGLKSGVTPLEMAKSYETLAERRQARVAARFAAYKDGPVTFTKVEGPGIDDKNDVKRKRVVPEGVAEQTTSDPPVASSPVGHRPRRPDRRVRGRQDRHHRELPGRLVRRLQRPADGRGLGRLSGGREADGDRVPRRAGRGRHLSRPRSGTTSCCRSARSPTRAPSPGRHRPGDGSRAGTRADAARPTRESEWRHWHTPTRKKADKPKTPSGGGDGRRPRRRPTPAPHRAHTGADADSRSDGRRRHRRRDGRRHGNSARERGRNGRRPAVAPRQRRCRPRRWISKVRPMTT